MHINVQVRRHDPTRDKDNTYWQDYDLEVESTSSVLDCLIKIREDLDGTLALRCSCRSSICGSCAMRINGQAGLACNTKVSDALIENDTVTVEPISNMPIVKDLVVD